MADRSLYIYMLASRARGALYTGVTNHLLLRVQQHREALCAHTRRYRIHRLVMVEQYALGLDALRREKEIKGWSRQKKIALIESRNPEWLDLYEM